MCYGENKKSISCGVAYSNRTLYKDGLGTELVKILRYFMPFTQTGNGLVKVKTDEAEVKKEDMKMTCFPKEITENGIHYTLHGDYYFPDLNLPDAPHQSIGHYGRMRKAYLEEHRPGFYEQLILSGKLYDHLVETEATCVERMNLMISRMAQAEGIDEELKAKDQMAWVGRMNNIRQRAEETILEEIVYA